jgi:tetratricopeptide (TPR) repeat protein
MGARVGRVVIATVASLMWLGGCETQTKLGDLLQSKSDQSKSDAADGFPSVNPDAEPKSTGSVLPPPGVQPDAVPKGLVGNDPHDDLNLGKKHFRDLESWIGLAASYDRLRRFDLADRAYDQAAKIGGPGAELLNNWGYSYMLRGDYRRARETLLKARALEPGNPYVKNNLELLEASFREGRAVQ